MTQAGTPPAPPPAPAPQPAPPADSVSLTINGRPVTAKKGTLLVEAARAAGIEIPVFCYHPKLKPVGACRMCLVQVEKLPRLQTACTTPVAADMVVSTTSAEVVAAQNGVLELLLANHPLDCPICDKGGECPLQDNTFRYGPGASRFAEEKEHKEKALPLSDRIVLDRERCIMCYRCVRFHQEVTGDEQLAALDRGGHSEIGVLPGEVYDSIFSGNTIELCPVGALTSRQYRFKARPWDLVRTPSVCSGCALGCNLEVHSRSERVLRLVSRENAAVDDGWLCDRGRFGTVPPAPEARATRPRVHGNRPRSVEWDEALRHVAGLVRGTPAWPRPAVGALVSASLSNEALWLAEHTLRPLLPDGAMAVWPATGDWPVRGSIASLADCRGVVLVGLDAWTELPVLALWVRRAVLRGATLVAIGATNGLYRDSAHWLKTTPGAEADQAARLLAALEAGDGARTDMAGEDPSLSAAAAALRQARSAGPVALLAGPGLAANPAARATLERLAAAVGADGERAPVGAPGLAANARGAQQLAPGLAAVPPEQVLARVARAERGVLLLLGDEPWAALQTGTATLVVATTRDMDEQPRVDVTLPLAHPYERQGSLTNLEGRVQFQEGGALPPTHARADWAVMADLARALGGSAPRRLAEVRAAMDAPPVSRLEPLPARHAGVKRG